MKFNYKRMKQALIKFKRYNDVTKAVMKKEEPTISRNLVRKMNTLQNCV